MLTATFVAWCCTAAAASHAPAPPAAPTAPAAPKAEGVVVESSSGDTLKEPNALIVAPDGSDQPAPVVRDSAPVACFRHAFRLFDGDRKQAVALCKNGTGNMDRVHCAEVLVRYMAGAYDDVARACADGGTVQTGQCVIDSARLLQGSYAGAISLCAHGGGPENYQCAKQGLIALGGYSDDVIELCQNLRIPFPTQR